jgi:hypothetical protein
MRHLPIVAVLAAIVVGATAAPGAAKESVEATLTTPVPLDASPGAEIALAWTLTSVDDEGKRQPFGASGIFVRLVSAGEGEPIVGRATGDNGRYEATVLAPDGGIGGIQIGLQGWTSDMTGTHRSDVFFPITNSPLPEATDTTPAAIGEPRPDAPAPPADTTSTTSPSWNILLLIALVAAAAALAVLLRRVGHPPAAR